LVFNLFCFGVFTLKAQSVTLEWSTNTNYTDYRVIYGTLGLSFSQSVGNTNRYKINLLTNRDFWFMIIPVNKDGSFGEASNIAEYRKIDNIQKRLVDKIRLKIIDE
jgi:hypothetical protein